MIILDKIPIVSDYFDSLGCRWGISSDKDWSVVDISLAMVFIEFVFMADRFFIRRVGS